MCGEGKVVQTSEQLRVVALVVPRAIAVACSIPLCSVVPLLVPEVIVASTSVRLVMATGSRVKSLRPIAAARHSFSLEFVVIGKVIKVIKVVKRIVQLAFLKQHVIILATID